MPTVSAYSADLWPMVTEIDARSNSEITLVPHEGVACNTNVEMYKEPDPFFVEKCVESHRSTSEDDFYSLDLLIAEEDLKKVSKHADEMPSIENQALLMSKYLKVIKYLILSDRYSEALQKIREGLEVDPQNLSLLEEAGKCLLHLNEMGCGEAGEVIVNIAQEIYAIVHSFAQSSSLPSVRWDALPFIKYVKLLLKTGNINATYSDYTLLQYCNYICNFFHYSKSKVRVESLVRYLVENGASMGSGIQDVPEELLYFALPGGKGRSGISGTFQEFHYYESRSNNVNGKGPRGICIKGNGIEVEYKLYPNPHDAAYNKHCDKIYQTAAATILNNYSATGNFSNQFSIQCYKQIFKLNKQS